MPTPLIIAFLIGLVIVLTAIRALVAAPRLSVAARILAALAFTLLALFCAFGFAAAMEPGDDHLLWRMVYGGVFLACVASVVRLTFARQKSETTEESPGRSDH